MRNIKRVIALTLCLFMVCTLLAGCGSTKSGGANPPSISSDDSGFGCIDPSVLDSTTGTGTATPTAPSP